MSMNAILDRETVSAAGQTTVGVEPLEKTPYALAQRDHLTLIDWNGAAPAVLVQNFAPVRPARRPWFGWSEAGVSLLLLASGAGAVASLLHL